MTKLTNLTVKEQALISSMNERLKRLEELYFSKGQETKQPIDTTEGYYVRCTSWQGELYTAGKIYQVVNGIIIDNTGFKDDYAHLIKHQPFFKPATYAEFLAQEQAPIETEQRWKPSYGVKYWYIGSNDGQFFVADFHWGNDDVDFVNYDTGNCFKSREAAQKAAAAIKQYLSTNKF
jgi:hypothetical protein